MKEKLSFEMTDPDGNNVSVEREGSASLDEVMDFFKSALILMGYSAEMASKLQICYDK